MRQTWYCLSKSPLDSVCKRIQDAFGLPEFRFDTEIDNDWGVAEKDGVEINVTKITLSRRERVEELPRGFPDHDYVIIASQKGESTQDSDHWFLDTTIQTVSQRLADVLAIDVHYANGVGPNRLPRFLVFRPR